MLTGRNVLLIDDDPLTNLVNKRLIEKYFPVETIVFTSACEALDQLKRWLIFKTNQLPEIIFLDINMPDMDGWEFLDELHKLPDMYVEQCNVIILSSSIDFEEIEKSKNYKSVRDFISKPLTCDALRSWCNCDFKGC